VTVRFRVVLYGLAVSIASSAITKVTLRGAGEDVMADKLLFVMMNTDIGNPLEVSTPFFQATIAAAMEYEVEVVFTGRAGFLAEQGVAEKILIQEGGTKTVYDLIREAHAAGVKFKTCSQIMDRVSGALIPEIEATVGGAYVISQAMNDNTVTFTY
jgi:predicted peroxiredoxin